MFEWIKNKGESRVESGEDNPEAREKGFFGFLNQQLAELDKIVSGLSEEDQNLYNKLHRNKAVENIFLQRF